MKSNDLLSLVPKPGSSTTSAESPELTEAARTLSWPSFSDMVELVLTKRKPTHSNSVLSFPQTSFQALLEFLFTLLKHHRKNLPPISSAIGSNKNAALGGYFELLQEAVVTTGSHSLNYIGAEHCLEVIQYAPVFGKRCNI